MNTRQKYSPTKLIGSDFVSLVLLSLLWFILGAISQTPEKKDIRFYFGVTGAVVGTLALAVKPIFKNKADKSEQ